MRPADRDTSKLPKWARDRLDYAERIAKVNADYWEKRVAEATAGKGPYTFQMEGMWANNHHNEISVRLVENDCIEIHSSYGGGLIVYPQVTNVIRVGVEKR
jgi:hypothetical protein